MVSGLSGCQASGFRKASISSVEILVEFLLGQSLGAGMPLKAQFIELMGLYTMLISNLITAQLSHWKQPQVPQTG